MHTIKAFWSEIETINIERNSPMKVLGVILEENLGWKVDIGTVVSKKVWNIGLSDQARQVLTGASLKTIYFSPIY